MGQRKYFPAAIIISIRIIIIDIRLIIIVIVFTLLFLVMTRCLRDAPLARICHDYHDVVDDDDNDNEDDDVDLLIMMMTISNLEDTLTELTWEECR